MSLFTEALVLAAVVGVLAWVVSSLLHYLRFRRMELAIPGPPSLPLLGNALHFMRATPDTALQTIHRMIGGRRELSRFSIMNHLLVAVNSPEDIDTLLRRPEFSMKAHFGYDLLDAPRGSLQLGGAEWRARRKALEPGFNKGLLDQFVGVFYEEAKGFVEGVRADEPVDLLMPLKQVNTRIFLRTSISADIAEIQDEVMPFIEFLEVFLRSVNQRMLNPLLWSDRVFGLTPLGMKVAKTKQLREAVVKRYVSMKREELRAREDAHLERQRKTLADIVVDLFDRAEIMERDVIDEIQTFFGANVETTVSTLSWTLKVLSILPETQELVYSEVVAVLGDRDVTSEDLPRLKFLDRVIKEVLRMFHPIPLVGRECERETELCGRTIPAHSTLILNIHGAHFDPEHWHEPLRFDPDRFTPENSRGRHPCAFIPFSRGSRNCIGGKYAMMNLTTFLATTVRAFRVLPVDDFKDVRSLLASMAFDLSTRLVGGTRVTLQPRRAP